MLMMRVSGAALGADTLLSQRKKINHKMVKMKSQGKHVFYHKLNEFHEFI